MAKFTNFSAAEERWTGAGRTTPVRLDAEACHKALGGQPVSLGSTRGHAVTVSNAIQHAI